MSAHKTTRSVVTTEGGVLAYSIEVDGEPYTILVSDIVPSCQADIKHFAFLVTGETQFFNDEDYEPFKEETK
jgi:hypothetical protein